MFDTTPLDTRALTDPLDRAAARAEYRSTVGSAGRWNAATVIAVVIAAVVGLFGVVVSGFLAWIMGQVDSGPTSALSWIAPVAFVIIPTIIIVIAVRGTGPSRRTREERAYRFRRFATANSLTYVPAVAAPPLPSSAFHGSDPRSIDVIRQSTGRFIEAGDHAADVSSGDSRRTVTWGYVAIHVGVPLPNLFLDARANDSAGGGVGRGFRGDQRLSLEGDFDRYFTLFCPQGYEADALYLFTPDVMARLIDGAAAFDVEIIDDWVILTSTESVATLDPRRWQGVQAAVLAITGKIAQWERWRDDRVDAAPLAPSAAPPVAPAAVVAAESSARGVAPGGRCLRRSAWRVWGSTAFGVAVMVLWFLLTQTEVFGFRLGG